MGQGLVKNNVEAVKWYRASSEFWNYPPAHFYLAFMYANGLGLPKDEDEAEKLYRAAEAEISNLDTDAVGWYLKAAERGDQRAQLITGRILRSGILVTKDSVQAVAWFRKAAEQGNAIGQLNLGSSYYAGIGVLKDKIEAYAYYNLAGITREDARKNLANLEKEMSPEDRSRGQQRSKELQKEIEAKIEAKQAGK